MLGTCIAQIHEKPEHRALPLTLDNRCKYLLEPLRSSIQKYIKYSTKRLQKTLFEGFEVFNPIKAKSNLLEMKGTSKCVDTAMRPVPERSHILKTWPTKAGPPPLPLEFRPPILTVDGKPEFELDSAEDKPFTVAEFEDTESGSVDSKGERVD